MIYRLAVIFIRSLNLGEWKVLRPITQAHPFAAGDDIFKRVSPRTAFIKDGQVEISGMVGG